MKKAVLGGLMALAVAQPAFAEGDFNNYEAGMWMIRARAIGVVPDESSSISPIGGTADFSNEVVPELDFTYFFTKNIAAELILATAKHKATAEGTAVGDVDVGSAWVLPPTLTLQYHFTDFGNFKPYVGAGVNYTMYLKEEPGSQNSIEFDDAFGVALQAGFDYALDEHWGVNLDVKKIYVDADAEWNSGAITADIDLDPWVIGAGVSYRF